MSKITPSVPIELDRVRHLQFDMNAAISYQRTLGKSIRQINPLAVDDEERLTLVWCCLLSEDEGLTRRAVGKMLRSFDDLARAYGLALRAVSQSMPDKEGEAPSKSPPPLSRWISSLCGRLPFTISVSRRSASGS